VEPEVSACVDVPGCGHHGELNLLADGSDLSALRRLRAIDLIGGDRSAVRPPIPDEIAHQIASGWRDTQIWLRGLAQRASDEVAGARTR